MRKIIILPHFRRQLKPYLKKHRRLKEDVIFILENFNEKHHIHLGNNIFKIRLKARDIPKGKNKSFRLILLLTKTEKFLVPLVIYFKGDQEDITKKN